MESGRRCIRSGTGNPVLCRAHRISFEEEARRAEPTPARRAGNVVADIVDDFLHGRPFDREKVATAVNEFAWSIGGNYTGYSPDIENAGPRQAYTPPRPGNGWHREAPPPPPQGPSDADLQKARRELGFGPADALTAETIKDRRRQLARKHHPDRGGSLERMKVINDAVDVLLENIT